MPGIIVGIDGSDHSKYALEWAMKEAAIRHAPLTVIIVHPVIAGFSGRAVAYPTDDALADKARETAREEVDKTLAQLGVPGPETVTVQAVSGFPAEVLISAGLDADMIVVGPGSLFTSILPNLLVNGLRQALFESQALKVYVCNVASQHGETDAFTVADHVRALERHLGRKTFHHVLANNNVAEPLPPTWHSSPVSVNGAGDHEPRLVVGDVIDESNRYRHDPTKLARALMRIYDGRSPETAPVTFEREPVI